jgi:hypothetical protein
VLRLRAHEIAEGTQDGIAELISDIQQRRGSGCQTDPLPVQLLQCLPACGCLRQRLFGLASLRPQQRLPLARFRDPMARVIRLARGPPGLVGSEGGLFDGVIASPLRHLELGLKALAVGGRLGCPVPERC